jgi:DNA-directed RNA polymerase subunit RPC12/RpoP
MKVETLKALIREGKKPMVRLTHFLWDGAFGGKGMLARIVADVDEPHDDLVRFTFDYNENRDHNLALDTPIWFIGATGKQGTAIEAGHFKDPNNITEDIIWDPKYSLPVELVEKDSLLNEYLADSRNYPPLGYVEWLEKQLNVARNQVSQLKVAHADTLMGIQEIPHSEVPKTFMKCPTCQGDIRIRENKPRINKEAFAWKDAIVCPHCGQRIKA